jgi:copper homeostasis protein
MLLEVCAFNIQSAIIAERCGAKRVELCADPVEGGTTPSHGTIIATRNKITIDLYPIIRPRSGNYFYDKDEMAIIKKEIEFCKSIGCDGISVGVQKSDGTIDVEALSGIVGWAYPLGVTCNRAFDAAPDPIQALEDIIESGCERILTSGQESSAPEGSALLAELVRIADGRIIIMPGAGVRSSNIRELVVATGATEFHTSAREKIIDPVTYKNPKILDAGGIYISNEEELRKILEVLNESILSENT